MDLRPPDEERLSARLGRQVRSRPPPTRARRIAWIVVGVVMAAMAIGIALGWVRFGWVDRLERRKIEEQRRERTAPVEPGR